MIQEQPRQGTELQQEILPGTEQKKQYITIKDLGSVSGCGVGIAIIGMVILELFPTMSIETARLVLKWVYFTLSFFASYLIYVNTNFGWPEGKRSLRINVIALLLVNAFLIFLSATGVNNLTNSIHKDPPGEIKQVRQFGLLPLLKNISIWPDAKLVEEAISYKAEIKILKDSLHSIQLANKEAFLKPSSFNMVLTNDINAALSTTDKREAAKAAKDIYDKYKNYQRSNDSIVNVLHFHAMFLEEKLNKMSRKIVDMHKYSSDSVFDAKIDIAEGGLLDAIDSVKKISNIADELISRH